jgi:CubicO group peptidase (beta-lactamase class C family)
MTIIKRACTHLLLLAALALPFAASAQTVRPEQVGLSAARLERIDALVERYIEAGDITGAVTLVARNGRIAHLSAQGVMDLESGAPMRSDTIFRIASMSKPVAATAILMLAEEGKLRITDPVSKFLPDYANLDVAVVADGAAAGGFGGPPPEHYRVPAEREITLLDLLTHTSGLMSGRVSSSYAGEDSGSRHEAGLRWVEGLDDVPLDFQPGSRWSYSGLGGFDVLSRVVEIVSGQSFDAFLKQRVFDPLGMRDATFWPNPEQRQRLVTSYTRTDEGLALRDNPDSMSSPVYFSGAGGLMTTAESYARFGMMLANGGEYGGQRILGKRTVELMGSAYIPDTLPGRPAGEGYGLGVRVVTDPIARRSTLSTGAFGWSGAYGTHFWADPKEGLVGILMIQTPIGAMRADFEDAVMQALVE